jgi:hypothetical protein
MSQKPTQFFIIAHDQILSEFNGVKTEAEVVSHRKIAIEVENKFFLHFFRNKLP